MTAGAESVLGALREAMESGDSDGLASLYSNDARLDVSVRGRRDVVQGPEAARAELVRLWPTPGRVLEFSSQPGEHGVALWMERLGDDGAAQRQRQYVHVGDGRITGHWIYGARPQHPEVVPPDESGPQAPLQLLETLGKVASQEVLVSTGWSGNRIERATLADGRRLIAKRIVPGEGWLERLSIENPDHGREGLLFTEGVIQRMPDEVDPTIVAAELYDDAWWVVMRDVSDHLFGAEGTLTREQNQAIMRGANAMWEAFWGDRPSMLGTQRDRLRMTARSVADRERDTEDFLPKQFEACWDAFEEAIDSDVFEAIFSLTEDPTPLVEALEPHGTTLIHGDLRDEQIGLDGERLVIVDWGAATQAHPVVELAWYMMHDVWRFEATHDQVIEDFRTARGDKDDPEALELGLVSGLMMYGWILGHSAIVNTSEPERVWAREELDWWVPRTRLALERTGLG